MNLLDEYSVTSPKWQCTCLPGGGFPAFGQAKPVVTPFGQAMAGPMVSSNPFLVSKRDTWRDLKLVLHRGMRGHQSHEPGLLLIEIRQSPDHWLHYHYCVSVLIKLNTSGWIKARCDHFILMDSGFILTPSMLSSNKDFFWLCVCVSLFSFQGAGPSAQYPAGGSSTNPFL